MTNSSGYCNNARLFAVRLYLMLDQSGILVNTVFPMSTCTNVLQPNDVILALDGMKLANDGTVHFRASMLWYHEISLFFPCCAYCSRTIKWYCALCIVDRISPFCRGAHSVWSLCEHEILWWQSNTWHLERWQGLYFNIDIVPCRGNC